MNALRIIDTEQRPPLALELPIGTTFDEWIAIGRKLRLGSQALNWHIGDWWKFGVSQWGEDETRKSAVEIWGVEGETARVYGWVAAKFAPVNRLTDLTFTHYQRAASLPTEDAQRMIVRAAHEGLSVRDVQREVQALKAANEPGEVGDVVKMPTEPSPAHERVPRKFVEWYIELAQRMLEQDMLTPHEEDRLAEAMRFANAIETRKKCPEDFERYFVENGRLACEPKFEVSRLTVNLWLIQKGKRRLIDERAAFVRGQRPHAEAPAPVIASGPIDEALYAAAKQAAHFLRVSRYGGWRISPAERGEWFVGTVRKTSDELIAMAERQGFDSEVARNSERG